MSAPSRPVLRYHGGKWKVAPWVICHFPPHRIYVEPFGGAASVLMRKERSYGEVYNDLDGEVVNVFRVLRDPERAEQLRRLVELTPFSGEEFLAAYEPSDDGVTRAHRMVVRSYMGFGSASMTRTHRTGFRSNSNRSGTTPAHDWARWPDHVAHFADRLKGVVVENRAAAHAMAQHDGEGTLHYVDPPYPWGTRSSVGRSHTHYYRHEMADADHVSLAEQLHDLEGMVVLSGYPCDLYDKRLFPTWRRHERKHFADGARERTEVLWLNDAAVKALDAQSHDLFAADGVGL